MRSGSRCGELIRPALPHHMHAPALNGTVKCAPLVLSSRRWRQRLRLSWIPRTHHVCVLFHCRSIRNSEGYICGRVYEYMIVYTCFVKMYIYDVSYHPHSMHKDMMVRSDNRNAKRYHHSPTHSSFLGATDTHQPISRRWHRRRRQCCRRLRRFPFAPSYLPEYWRRIRRRRQRHRRRYTTMSLPPHKG